MALSQEMRRAVQFAKLHGNKLTRHPGGFWTGLIAECCGTSFGTSTVEALVKRGAASYTAWKDGRNGRFPTV